MLEANNFRSHSQPKLHIPLSQQTTLYKGNVLKEAMHRFKRNINLILSVPKLAITDLFHNLLYGSVTS